MFGRPFSMFNTGLPTYTVKVNSDPFSDKKRTPLWTLLYQGRPGIQHIISSVKGSFWRVSSGVSSLPGGPEPNWHLWVKLYWSLKFSTYEFAYLWDMRADQDRVSLTQWLKEKPLERLLWVQVLVPFLISLVILGKFLTSRASVSWLGSRDSNTTPRR